MSVATGTTSRRFRRRQVFAAVAIVLALAIAASALVVSSLGGSASTTVRPAVPFVSGVGAPENVATEAADAGAAELGTTDYEIQTGALFVSPSGDNDADGSLESPLRTIKAALARVSAGGMIVLRAGEYHEAFTIAEGVPLTVQSYPGEVVWLDGSEVVEGWQADGEQPGEDIPVLAERREKAASRSFAHGGFSFPIILPIALTAARGSRSRRARR